MFGKQAGEEYNRGIRKSIKNDKTIIGFYGVNKEGSGDMYYKGASIINIVRQTINNDEKFRSILRGINAAFYHQTVTTRQIEDYISDESKIDFSKLFDQYLRNTQIPLLEYYFSKNNRKIFFRWTNCIKGFALPINIKTEKESFFINPTEDWRDISAPKNLTRQLLQDAILKRYYIEVKEVKSKA